jgi:hypothetical protein
MEQIAAFKRNPYMLGTFPEEVAMPHRRKVRKGSFGSHFDELIDRFPKDGDTADPADKDESERKDRRHVNDRLFESAWRKAPENHDTRR